MSLTDALRLPTRLKELGCEKINIAGGEPLLVPYIDQILKACKEEGLVTSMVTNGSLLNEAIMKKINPYIDWIGFSIDSLEPTTLKSLRSGSPEHIKRLINLIDKLREMNINIKINTVVTRLNYKEDLRSLIRRIDPDRWKIFQVLMLEGENDQMSRSLLITAEEFNRFKEINNMNLRNDNTPVFESNDDMKGSYCMIDPLGRLFDNSNGNIEYQRNSILSDYVQLFNYGFDQKKYLRRGAIYSW